MMAWMTVSMDTRAFDRDTQQALRRSPRVAADALRVEQVRTFRDSQREVPVDTGNLAGSGQTPQPFVRGTRIIAVIEYTAVYAFSVHENPRSGQTGGVSPQGQRYPSYARRGKWKYLEHPMRRADRGFDRRVGRYLLIHLFR